MSETETRARATLKSTLRADLTEARAELSRLRGVVEAVHALADEPGSGFPYVRQAALHAALAPVSSSGEAESGEGREHETFAYGQSGYDGDACRTCRWEGPPGSAAQHRAETRSPAPVPSGGQADREGEVERVISVSADLLVDVARRLYTAGDDAVRGQVEALLEGRDWQHHARAEVAARPVLSREALAIALHDADPRHKGCERLDHRPGHWWLAQADAVLDVLAGGEQA